MKIITQLPDWSCTIWRRNEIISLLKGTETVSCSLRIQLNLSVIFQSNSNSNGRRIPNHADADVNMGRLRDITPSFPKKNINTTQTALKQLHLRINTLCVDNNVCCEFIDCWEHKIYSLLQSRDIVSYLVCYDIILHTRIVGMEPNALI